jgi:hypothetical protein
VEGEDYEYPETQGLKKGQLAIANAEISEKLGPPNYFHFLSECD